MTDSNLENDRKTFGHAVQACAPPQSSGLRVAFFGHDSNESTVRKRVNGFQYLGATVTGFMFSRRHDKPTIPPTWMNVALGQTEDGYHGKRLVQLAKAISTLFRHQRLLREADVLYARNIDMLLLATAGKILGRVKAPIIYEALDVHPAFTGKGVKSRIFRFAERRLLAISSLLIVSSPVFMDRYFIPIQKYTGPWFLLENKLGASAADQNNLHSRRRTSTGSPWIIGWFGVIRCQRSIEILMRLAARFPKSVMVHIRGLPSERDDITADLLKDLERQCPNVRYFGVYQSPRDLSEIYGAVDLVWAVDFSASGANSDWLIPNRFYEGGLNGVPALARQGTATGDLVERRQTGWCIAEPFEANLTAFIEKLDIETYATTAKHIRSMDRDTFVDLNDTRELLHKLNTLARRSSLSA